MYKFACEGQSDDVIPLTWLVRLVMLAQKNSSNVHLTFTFSVCSGCSWSRCVDVTERMYIICIYHISPWGICKLYTHTKSVLTHSQSHTHAWIHTVFSLEHIANMGDVTWGIPILPSSSQTLVWQICSVCLCVFPLYLRGHRFTLSAFWNHQVKQEILLIESKLSTMWCACKTEYVYLFWWQHDD